MNKFCVACGGRIDPERLEVNPEAVHCIDCARKYPEPPRHDPNLVCARGSSSGRNGFASSD